MVQSRIINQYSLDNGLIMPRQMPHGETGFNGLFGWFDDIDELKYRIETEVSNLDYCLCKYEGYEPENKQMCIELRQLKTYLEKCYVELTKVS